MTNESRPTRNLRIAHVTATFPPYQGGAGTVCFHNARELARCGHEVHVFTAARSGAQAREVRDGFTIHRLRPLVQVGNAPLLPGLIRALRGFDVIHLHYPFIIGAEMVRLAACLYRTPLILSFHNDLIGDGARAQLFSVYQRLSAWITVRGVARLCAVSLDHYQSSVLRRSLTERKPPAVELPNGVDINHFYPADSMDKIREQYDIPADSKMVLFVAALDRAHHFKGLGRLLHAFQSLPPDVRLMVVGDGDLRQTYQQQANALGLIGRTIFVGAIAHEDTPPFFRSADVTALPSSLPESFGLVLIESLACATPVIASNIPGVRTVVNHGSDGLLVEAESSTALAEAIWQILSDDATRREMGRRGRAKAEARYGWEQIGLQLEEIYQEALSCRRYPRMKQKPAHHA